MKRKRNENNPGGSRDNRLDEIRKIVRSYMIPDLADMIMEYVTLPITGQLVRSVDKYGRIYNVVETQNRLFLSTRSSIVCVHAETFNEIAIKKINTTFSERMFSENGNVYMIFHGGNDSYTIVTIHPEDVNLQQRNVQLNGWFSMVIPAVFHRGHLVYIHPTKGIFNKQDISGQAGIQTVLFPHDDVQLLKCHEDNIYVVCGKNRLSGRNSHILVFSFVDLSFKKRIFMPGYKIVDIEPFGDEIYVLHHEYNMKVALWSLEMGQMIEESLCPSLKLGDSRLQYLCSNRLAVFGVDGVKIFV